MSSIGKVAMLALVILGAGALVLPALAHSDHGVSGRGSGPGGMMMGGGVAGGCMQMMQGMAGGQRPNQQWRTAPRSGRS